MSNVCAAGPLTTSVSLAAAALAQAEGAKKDPRAESDELIARARDAMSAHHWETAESLIKRAESLHVKYGLLHLGDTPAKARKDLDKLMKGAPGEPQRPSLRFAPQGEEDKPGNKPAKAGATPDDPFATPKKGVEITLDDPAARARASLAKGRKEFEQGNLAAAAHWCREAAEQNAEFGPNDDTPDRLMADIQAAGGSVSLGQPAVAPQGFDATISAASGAPMMQGAIDPEQDAKNQAGIKLSMRRRDADAAATVSPAVTSPFGRATMTEPPREGDTGPALTVAGTQADASVFELPASSQAAMPADVAVRAESLLLEARRALAKGDIRQAATFVNQAEKSGANFPLDGDSPARVKALLELGGRAMQRQGADAESVEARRELVSLLMEQAAGLLYWQDFELAERLVADAEQVPLEYGPFDPRPAELRQAIAAAREKYAATHPVAEREYNTRSNLVAPAAATVAGDNSAEFFLDEPVDQDWNNIFGDAAATVSSDPSGASAPASGPAAAEVAAPAQNVAQAKAHALQLLGQARKALAAGDLNAAEHLAREAAKLKVPETAYGQRDDNPWLVMLEIQNARGARPAGAAPASAAGQGSPVAPAVGPGVPIPSPVRPTAADGALPAEFQLPNATMEEASSSSGPNSAADLPALPTSAAPERLPSPDGAPLPVSPGAAVEPAPLSETPGLTPEVAAPVEQSPAAPTNTPLMQGAAADQQLLARQLVDESGTVQQQADRMRESDPRGALKLLTDMRAKIADSKLDATSKDQLVRRMNGRIADLEKYIQQNKSRIDLAEKNKAIRADRDRKEEVKIEVQGKLAVMVDEYNRLIDERRFAEAEVVAKRAAEIAPDDVTSQQLVKQLVLNSAFLRANANQMDVRDLKQQRFLDAMQAVDDSSVPFDDNNPYQLPDAKFWQQLTARRKKPSEGIQRTPKEREIERKLQTDVTVKFDNAPLATVINYLGQLAQVNIHIDHAGLAEEGVTSDTPVSIDVGTPIMLKSALGLILEQHKLAYTIKNEVLNITSEQLLETRMVKITYNVADLVIPIPNFTPNSNLGMTGLLNNAYQAQIGYMGGGGAGFGGGPPLAVMAQNSSNSPAPGGVSPEVLAQMGGATGPGGGPSTQPMGFGPGGMGGGAQADFDTLIDLITTTIAPTSWDEVGGSGSIQPFPTNLSLVISNTEEVHEQIVDLLDQLRRLQDLQVTIEVRFITLNDSFFERIGVDFDFDINDKIDAPLQPFGNPDPNFQPSFSNLGINTGPGRNVQDRDFAPSATVGMSNPGIFSADLDIPFRQGNFDLAVPQFGGFDPAAGASLGFAILSDLEAYFFINAAQGDRRSNVLQAPKVTLFNGQQAFVADTSQSPFVISVVPVVGDFAAAQQPVIVVLSEGTYLTVQAVASPDRRFVRLTVVPFFSQIGEVNTFTFTGETSSTVINSSQGPDDDTTSRDNEVRTTTSGTTVQLPTFSFLSVATTVSVPDGGSVLLGGVKRLSEGRNEFGVPILNKLPYISRLFKNVGIGRETQSLMMMVTPRIIIQEEEEELLGVLPQQP
ncbi:MAG: hypothetical protein KF708_20035 [Pirellulales bacterium]|nr:hypothetical protein [Pirellulales bacterium]